MEWIWKECDCICGNHHDLETKHSLDGRTIGVRVSESSRLELIRRKNRRYGMPIAVRCLDCKRRILIAKFKPVE